MGGGGGGGGGRCWSTFATAWLRSAALTGFENGREAEI